MALKATYLVGKAKGVPLHLAQRTFVGARLESRCRSEEAIEQGLEARIADPLWMLARQWQMGEFQGEDNGSPIRVQIQYRTEHADRVLLSTGTTSDFINVRTPVPFVSQDDTSPRPPLETAIEREPVVRDWRVRVQMGQQFERFLRRAFAEQGELTKANQIICIYREPEHFGLKIPEDLVDVDYATQRFLKLMEGRVIDGSAALEAYENGALPVPDLPNWSNDDQENIKQVFQELQDWFTQLYSEPESEQEVFWNPQQLEYEFTLRKESVVTGGNGSDFNIELSAPDYRNGDLDWYSCDLLSRSKSPPELIEILCPELPPGMHRVEHIYVGPNSSVDFGRPLVRIVKLKPPIGAPVIVRANRTGKVHEVHVQQNHLVLEGQLLLTLKQSYPQAISTVSCNPTRIGFAGKPNERWWALEDYKVDLARLNPNTSELAKLMFTEFALVHADDWYLVPLELPLGSLTSIASLRVENVFGDLMAIGPALEAGAAGRDRWELFTLDRANHPEGSGVPYLFIPPSLGDREESPPIEEVRFIRDEGANMVFAIEHTVANGLGNPVQGFEAQVEHRERNRKLKIAGLEKMGRSLKAELARATLSEEDRAALTEDAEELKTLIAQQRRQGSPLSVAGLPQYRFASMVPDNWIPFVPRRVSQDHAGLNNVTEHSIRLRQAVMMRNEIANNPAQVTPMTRILHDQQLPEQSINWLNEESVPRAGMKVQLTRQRVRYTDGKTYVWFGRKVKMGRGEGSSGLRFDCLK